MQASSSGEQEGGSATEPAPLLLSVSGLGRLTACEEKFLRSRDTEDDGQRSTALQLGTLMHQLMQEHMLRRDWRADWQRRLTAEPGWTDEWEPPGVYETANWLMERYEEVYADDPLTTIATEVPFDLELPGWPSVRVRGYIDGLAHGPDGLVLVELKTMGKWGKADRAAWEAQVPTYLWAARQLGLPVTGCVFRAVYTYRSKDPKPPAASFRDVWVPWSPVQEQKVLRDFRNAGIRGRHLVEHPEEALRTVGEPCNWCPFRRDCLGVE